MTNKPPEVKEVFSDVFWILDRPKSKSPVAANVSVDTSGLKNVTPKVPVQLIDHWCNDGASEPEWGDYNDC